MGCGRTVVGFVASLGGRVNREGQRFGNRYLQGFGEGASVNGLANHHRVGCVVGDAVHVPSVGFAASGVSNHLRTGIANHQRDVFAFVFAGSRQNGRAAVVDFHVGKIAHIQCVGGSLPSYRVFGCVSREGVCHIRHILTIDDYDGRGGEDRGVEIFHNGQSGIHTVGIDPVLGA